MIEISLPHILQFFANALQQDKMYHTFLLITGDREGIHSTISIAKFLQCKNRQGISPCNTCSSCTKVEANIHPDVHLISAGDKKSITIDQIREISSNAHVRPWEGKFKFFILPAVHLLREEAANALLKILEEPPSQTIFLLTAENEHQIIPTILSRSQIFSIGVDHSQALKILTEKHNLMEEQAKVALALAGGKLQGAIEIKKHHWQKREDMLQLFLQRTDPIRSGEKVAELCGSGEEGRRTALNYIDFMAAFWRDVLVAQMAADSQMYWINLDYKNKIQSIAAAAVQGQIFHLLEFLLQAKRMVRQNVTLALIWENIFLKIWQTGRCKTAPQEML